VAKIASIFTAVMVILPKLLPIISESFPIMLVDVLADLLPIVAHFVSVSAQLLPIVPTLSAITSDVSISNRRKRPMVIAQIVPIAARILSIASQFLLIAMQIFPVIFEFSLVLMEFLRISVMLGLGLLADLADLLGQRLRLLGVARLNRGLALGLQIRQLLVVGVTVFRHVGFVGAERPSICVEFASILA